MLYLCFENRYYVSTTGWIQMKSSVNRRLFCQWNQTFLPPPSYCSPLTSLKWILGNSGPAGMACWETGGLQDEGRISVNYASPSASRKFSLDPTP